MRCTDVAPPTTQYTCVQQASFGKCSRSWMKGFCLKSCGTDVPPPPAVFTCAQQASFGQCKQPWMKGYCLKTCGTDEPPPPKQSSCAKAASDGKCSKPFMKGYCLKSCRMCGSVTHSVPTPAPVLQPILMHPSKPSQSTPGQPYNRIIVTKCRPSSHAFLCVKLFDKITAILKFNLQILSDQASDLSYTGVVRKIGYVSSFWAQQEPESV